MTGRSFQSIDFNCEDDIHKLLYCAYWVGTSREESYDSFVKTIKANPRHFTRAINQISQHNLLAQQFSALTPVMTGANHEDGAAPPFMGDVAARLVIAGGMDAHYVMRDMTIDDMLLFIKALDDKQRQEAESQRLWTYISILPHIDRKKLKSPQKLIVFPWETAARQQEAIQTIEELKTEFEAFMRGGTPDTLKTETQEDGK